MTAQHEVPGLWARRVGLREPAPVRSVATRAAPARPGRRRGERAETLDDNAVNAAGRSGGASDEWAQRVLAAEAPDVARAERMCVAAGFTGAEPMRIGRAFEAATDGVAVAAARRDEVLAMSRRTVTRSVATARESSAGRRAVRFDDGRAEHRAKVEMYR